MSGFVTRPGTNDVNVILSCYEEDEYTLKGWVRPGDVCIDIGAHIGGASALMASLGGIVYAYEPVSENHRMLCENMARNGHSASHCIHAAVMGYDGSVMVYLSTTDMHHRNIGTTQNVTTDGEEVWAVTLDTIFSANQIEHCRVVKIDCEGPEWEILESASVDCLSRIDRIVGEYHLPRALEHPRQELLTRCKGLFEDVTPEPEHVIGTGAFDFRRRGVA